MKKIIVFIVLTMAFLVTATMPSTVSAYGKITHNWVIIQGFDLFKCPGPEPCDYCPKHYYPELELPFDNNQVYKWWPSNNLFSNIMVEGGAEDDHNHVGYDLPVSNTMSHFWDGDDPDDLVLSDFLGGIVYDIPNALDNARRLIKQARELYLSGNKADAYDQLSHAIHLIGDMTVPAHAHVIDHPFGDSYDDWAKYPEEEPNTFLCNHARWTSNDARAAGGPVEVPRESADAVYTSIVASNNDGLWPPLQPGADLYYLIYTANQYGDYYGCQGETFGAGSDGDDYDKRAWVNYAAPPFSNDDDPPLTEERLVNNSEMLECVISPTCPVCMMINPTCWLFIGSVNDDDGDLSKIASTNLVYAYRAASAMIKSFRDSIDTVPPVSEISLEGMEGHDGWYRSDVVMHLSATDNLQFPSEHMISQWLFMEAPEDTCWWDYDSGHLFLHEGIKEIKYRSIDGLGNEEMPQTASIKIDRTPPDITITSPEKDGFYLTSDTLTIDFVVSDGLSGIYSYSAKLDGVDVSDGQVLDLANMGGWHTLAVTAEDYAGNQSSLSVKFSIKIHATVDFKPDVFNLKSMGVPVITYIEFPAGYDVTQIDEPESRLSFVTGWLYVPDTKPTEVGDYDVDGIIDVMLHFDKQNTKLPFKVDQPQYCDLIGTTVTVKVRGELNDTTEFYGEDTVVLTCPNCNCPLK